MPAIGFRRDSPVSDWSSSTPSAATLSLAGIQEAHLTVEKYARRTPVGTSNRLSELLWRAVQLRNSDVNQHLPPIKLFFKCENFQESGSFKFRGAIHFISKLSDAALQAGLVAYSTGNHAYALAFASKIVSKARGFQIPVEILMTPSASQAKMRLVESQGAKVTLCGPTLLECITRAESIQKETGATLVPPSAHPNIALGQGTVMLEFVDQMKELGETPLDMIVVPSAGGALLAGTAIVAKGMGDATQVFASEPKHGGAKLMASRNTGHRNTKLSGSTIADGLRSTVGQCNWEIVQHHDLVAGVFAAEDQEIRDSLRYLVEELKVLLEPSAAVPFAALMFNTDFHQTILRLPRAEQLNIGVVLTGANISLADLSAVFNAV